MDLNVFISSQASDLTPAPSWACSDSYLRSDSLRYSAQLQESRRERTERAETSKTKKLSSPVQLNSFIRRPAFPAPQIQPESTRKVPQLSIMEQNIHPSLQKHVSFTETVSVMNGKPRQLRQDDQRPRLKRISKAPHQSSFRRSHSRRYTTLTLAIDKHGRAKIMVTKVPR